MASERSIAESSALDPGTTAIAAISRAGRGVEQDPLPPGYHFPAPVRPGRIDFYALRLRD